MNIILIYYFSIESSFAYLRGVKRRKIQGGIRGQNEFISRVIR